MVKLLATFQDGHSEPDEATCKCKLPKMVHDWATKPNVVSILLTEL